MNFLLYTLSLVTTFNAKEPPETFEEFHSDNIFVSQIVFKSLQLLHSEVIFTSAAAWIQTNTKKLSA